MRLSDLKVPENPEITKIYFPSSFGVCKNMKFPKTPKTLKFPAARPAVLVELN